MKNIIILLFLCSALTSSAQYNKEKLTTILTKGSTKTWSVKGTNMTLSEKTFAFNINGALIIEKDDGSGKISTSKESWSLTTKDNIRWFLMIGSQEHEIIVSYEKNGSQYVKLTHQASGKNTSVYYEAILHSLK